MALTINQLVAERRKTLHELKKLLRKVDTMLELQQRYLDRILSRKKKLPEQQDLQYLSQKLDQMVQAAQGYEKELAKGFVD